MDLAGSDRPPVDPRLVDRRVVGIVVLLLAVLIAAVLPALGGRRITGVAVHAAVPLLGDCVAGVTSRRSQEPVAMSDTGWPVYPPSRAPLGRCTDVGAGRVLAIRYGVTIGGPAPMSSLQEREDRTCDPAVQDLRHTVAGPDASWSEGNREIGLRAVVRLSVELIGAPADAADQWVACVPFRYTADGVSALSLTGGNPMDQLGECRSSGTSRDIVSCTEPHRAEVIGRAELAFGSPDRSDYAAACRDFFATATGVRDTGAIGLALQVQDSPDWPQGPGDCVASVVDPARTLSGSLVGLHGAAVPWTR